MDENKRQKLIEIGYSLKEICGTCIHFVQGQRMIFGTCAKFQYDHLKHTDKTRQLSVCKYGWCEGHERFDLVDEIVGEFKEFRK
jgi:hypothetical protein